MDDLFAHHCGDDHVYNKEVDNGKLPDLSDELIQQIYDGKIPKGQIPEKLYFETARIFNKAVGAELGSFGYDDATNAMASVMRSQIFEFSASKSQAMHFEMRDAMLFQDGKIRPFNEFKPLAKKISGKYVKHWLAAEYNTAISTTQMAIKWKQFTEDEEIYPFLIYRTVGDGRVSDEHAVLDGIKLRVNDPRWNTIMPPNRFNCRCWVEQSDDEKDLNDEDLTKRVESAKIKPMFAANPGKKGLTNMTNIYDLPEVRRMGKKQLDPVKTYNMKSLEKIYQKNNFPAVSMTSKAEYEDWFDKQVLANPDHKATGFIFDDKLTGRKIRVSKRLKDKLPNKDRYYGHEITNTIGNPDEIWTTSTKNTYKTVYIKYYKDKPYSALIDVDPVNGVLKFNSFYQLEPHRYKELRKGILEYRKSKTAKTK